MKQHELISEDEWFRRMVKETRYRVININWDAGITRILDTEDGEMYDVEAVSIKSRNKSKIMLKLVKI